MPYSRKLSFKSGGTITGQKPGQKIKAAVDEIQSKSITDLKSSVPGLGFEKAGANTLRLVAKSGGGGVALLQVGVIKNDGAAGSAGIRYVNGIYYLDITFPRVNRTTSIEFQSEG